MKSTHEHVRKGRMWNVTGGGGYGMTQKPFDIRGGVLAFILPGWVFKFYEKKMYFWKKRKKLKLTLEQATKAQTGSRGIAVLFL